MHLCMESSGQCWAFNDPLFLRQGVSLISEPQGSVCLHLPQNQGYRYKLMCLAFYMGAWDPKSGPYLGVANTFLTETNPQPSRLYFVSVDSTHDKWSSRHVNTSYRSQSSNGEYLWKQWWEGQESGGPSANRA